MHPFIMVFVRLIEISAWIYSLILIARVLASWFPGAISYPLRHFLETVTEPALMPIRRLLNRVGLAATVDLSPLLLLLCVHVLRRLLVGALLRLG
ncbi:MAG: YggT family protein [Candidatus Bipolaricaulota bacterium]